MNKTYVNKEWMMQLLPNNPGMTLGRRVNHLIENTMGKVSLGDPKGATRFWSEVMIVASDTLHQSQRGATKKNLS